MYHRPSYNPQYFFLVSMKNACMGIIFYEFIFRIVGNFFSCQYKLGVAVGHWNNFLHPFYLLYYTIFFLETFIKNRSCCFLFRNSLTFKSGSSQVHYSSINFLQVICLLVTCCSISIMALLLLLYLHTGQMVVPRIWMEKSRLTFSLSIKYISIKK